MCTVSINIDEATMQRINPCLTSRESIGQWLQHQVDLMIEKMIAVDVKPYTVEELLERAEKGRKEIARGNYVTSENLFRDLFEELSRLMERPVALQDRVFKKLFEQAEIAKYSVEERRQYEASQKEYWDYTSTLETAELKGEKKGEIIGEKKGLIKGEKKKAIDVAKRMKADGLPVEMIAKYTELPPEQIEKL